MSDLSKRIADLTPEKRELLLLKLNRKKREAGDQHAIRPQSRETNTFPLSFSQERLWFIDQLDPGNPAYNIRMAVRMIGRLDVAALQRSLDEIVRRHESLRTIFIAQDGQPFQSIAPAAGVPLPLIDLRDLPEAEREAHVRRQAVVEVQRPFDLARGPSLRTLLLRLDEAEHLALLTMHHIISDGWSLAILMRELAALYAAYSENRAATLPDPPIQYADFAVWQRERLQGEGVLADQLAYWTQRLGGRLGVVELPIDRPRPPVQSFRGAKQSFALSRTLTEQLKALAQSQGATPFMTLLAALDVLLYRYTGQEDILIGSPIAGRNRAEVEDLIGFFANTLVLRSDLSDNPTFRELLDRVRETALGAYAHQDLPFEKLVEELQPERDLSRNPIFQVMFILLNTPAPALELPGLTLSPLESDSQTARFDLTLTVVDSDQDWLGTFEYNTDLFDAETVERMVAHWQVLLEDIAAHPDRRLSDLCLLTDAERRQLLVTWNDTARDYPHEECLHDLFAAQAARTPDAVALVFEAEHITYAELNRRADRLASYLQTLGIGPERLVGVFMRRSPEMVVGLLGVFKAGGAYVPLDPAYPPERLALMLEDSGAAVVLTQQAMSDRLPPHNARVVRLDADWPATPAPPRSGGRGLHSLSSPDNLAYVIYTSGSTGRPKGVALQHRSAVAFSRWAREVFSADDFNGVLASTSISFDLSIFELFTPMHWGGKVILAENALQLPTLPAASAVTLINTVPSAMTELLQIGGVPDSVRVVGLGGEPVSRALVQAIYRRKSIRALFNLYGPTEDTTYSTFALLDRDDDKPPSIGRPIAGTHAYIFDRYMQPAPIGVPGELYLGGAGLARGYLNRPDLTAERFIPAPPMPSPSEMGGDKGGGRLYRTGDLARYRPDGAIEFLGRIDHQVKVRGYRIELGEIESELRTQRGVREAVVLAREDTPGDKRLVAYVVRAPEDAAMLDELRRLLQAKLPAYMIPAHFVFLDALPLTPNGKVDRRALPAPEFDRPELAEIYLAPESELERTLAGIWQDVLKVERVGVQDNFFDLGGHSLLLVRAHSKLCAALQRDIPLIDLFRYPTIATLAAHLGPRPRARIEPRRARAKAHGTDIAIVGMAGRFPGARDVEQFWRNLRDGIESISFFTDDELLAAGVDPVLLNNPGYVKARGALNGVEWFDASFFGYTPREAEIMDPQQRVFLECAWEALERAGYDPETSGQRISVYAGVSLNSYLLFNLYPSRDALESAGFFQSMVANDKDFVATRVSYKLNLKGPSFTVQTACSTSLVAVHLACRSLLDGECDMALAGGVSINVPQKAGYLYQAGGIFSADGHCRAFDASAQGTLAGSGAGIVVLKRLDAALADGDVIHAVIKGSAINNDGSLKVGYTAPSVEGQAEVIAEAQAMAGVEPDGISYIEAHGTGTALGDPIEIAALTQVYRERTERRGFCAIGSVKTNIGHLDAAAGVAGLIKTVLALKHRELPPSLHYQTPNPQIDFASSPFFVNAQLRVWESSEPCRAGVSSFGIGGTNAHVIVEEAPAVEASGESRAWQVLALSARTESALETMAANLSAYFQQHPEVNLADVAYTLGVGRKAFAHRGVVVCSSREEAIEALNAGAMHVGEWGGGARPVVFQFPGGGAQYVNMGRGLYQTELVFRQEVDRCAEILITHLGYDIRSVLYPEASREAEAQEQMRRPPAGLSALFAVEYALARLWQSWGVRPSALIGHSLGEYVAACVAGVFTLEEALGLVAMRGRLMERVEPGGMLSVPLSQEALATWLTDETWLAVENGPGQSVVSGQREAIEQLGERLREAGIEVRAVPIEVAAHSVLVEPILDEFVAYMRGLKLNAPQMRYISNVSGTWIRAEEVTDAAYWGRHLRSTVRYGAGLAEVLNEQDAILIEVGPGHTLSGLVQMHPSGGRERIAVTTLRHVRSVESDEHALANAVARLWAAGVRLDWRSYYAGERRHRVELPTYPFERQRYWIEPNRQDDARRSSSAKKIDPADWFYIPAWRHSMPPIAVEPMQPAHWLVFEDDHGLGTALADRFQAAGHSVTRARAGEVYRRIEPNLYALNPDRPEDYQTLLGTFERLPDKVLHCWSLNSDAPPSSSFYSLLYLAQSIGKHSGTDRVEITVISNGLHAASGDETLHTEQATLLGPCIVIPQEYPNVACRNIDIDEAVADRLADRLIAELALPSPEAIVAYRGRHRWVQGFEPARLEAVGGSIDRLRQNGVYLITGGLGDIGLILAGHLAQRARARLVLVGRSTFPPREAWDDWLATHAVEDEIGRKIRRIRAIEATGAEVLVARADVTDESQMRDVLRQAIDRFGELNGVIHAAGLPGGGMIQFKTPEAASSVLAPKVRGAIVLDALLQDMALDFFIVVSSHSSILGGAGLVDYCAANAFLDAFAHARTARGAFTLALNWGRWHNVGMALIVEEQHKTYTGETLTDGMTVAEGLEAFDRALARSALPQVIVSTRDFRALFEQSRAFTAASLLQQLAKAPVAQARHARPRLRSAYVAPRDDVERKIAGIWQEMLGIDRVGIHDNFFELGGHSLLAIQIASRARESLQVELPLRLLFEEPTVAGLAAAAAHSDEARSQIQKRARGDRRKERQALESLDQLSIEEVDDLLAEILPDAPGESGM